MSYIQVPNEAFDLLSSLRGKYPQYKSNLESMEEALNLRLWNQLSDDLIAFSSKEELKNSTDLVTLYNNLIMPVEKAFNPMKLISIIQNVIKNFSSKLILFNQPIREYGRSIDLFRKHRGKNRS